MIDWDMALDYIEMRTDLDAEQRAYLRNIVRIAKEIESEMSKYEFERDPIYGYEVVSTKSRLYQRVLLLCNEIVNAGMYDDYIEEIMHRLASRGDRGLTATPFSTVKKEDIELLLEAVYNRLMHGATPVIQELGFDEMVKIIENLKAENAKLRDECKKLKERLNKVLSGEDKETEKKIVELEEKLQAYQELEEKLSLLQELVQILDELQLYDPKDAHDFISYVRRKRYGRASDPRWDDLWERGEIFTHLAKLLSTLVSVLRT